MSKKKLKKMLRKALKQQQTGASSSFSTDTAASSTNAASKTNSGNGLLGSLGLPGRFGSTNSEQFIIGALLGAATAYVLADENLRGKIMKSMLKLYGGLSGGFEEFKEQLADLKAEITAEHNA